MDMNGSNYRKGAALGGAATLMLVWIALGVGILGSDGARANLMYTAVVGVGVIGSLIVRFRAKGMSRVLDAMAAVQASITVIALLGGAQDSGASPVAEIVLVNAFFVAMFLASAWLFRNAADPDPKRAVEALIP